MQVENSRMIYRGSGELARVYRGDNVIVWEPGSGNPYDSRYLTLHVLDLTGCTNDNGWVESVSGTKMVSFIKFDENSGTTASTNTDIEFSVNGGPWISYSAATDAQKTVVDGDSVRFRGYNTSYSDSSNYWHHSLRISNSFYNISGNILSMVYGDDFAGKSLSGTTEAFRYFFGKDWVEWYGSEPGYCRNAKNLRLLSTGDFSYQFLFHGQCLMLYGPSEFPAMDLSEGCYYGFYWSCYLLEKAPSILPATTLQPQCYYGMFESCYSMENAPVLPATAMTNSAYTQMFHYCTSLETAPELPATVLAPYCYAYMFNSCSSLEEAPILPATSLTNYCYIYMFAFCESLNYIKCLAEYNIGGTANTANWVYDVASAGTFVEAENTHFTWTIGDNGIPTNWVKRDYIPYEEEYTTLDIISGGTINISRIYNMNYSTQSWPGSFLFFSKNGDEWIGPASFDSSDVRAFSAITVNAGDKIRVKGLYEDRHQNWLPSGTNGEWWAICPSFSGSTASFNVYGNALSLIYSDGFTGQTSSMPNVSNGFSHLFECSPVVNADNWVLPDGYYPAWTMFETFMHAYTLESAPVIRATSAYRVAFTETFYFCQNLNYIKCLLDSTADVGFNRWVTSVSPTGTFVKKSGVSYRTGEDGIPSGWTVQEI